MGDAGQGCIRQKAQVLGRWWPSQVSRGVAMGGCAGGPGAGEHPLDEMIIRPARIEDLPVLVEMYQDLSLEGESREEVGSPLAEAYGEAFQEIEADPRQRLLVAEAGGRMVATLVLVIVPNLTQVGRPWAVIENVVVARGERDRGYGEILVRHAIDEARRAGCYRMSVTCDKRRPDASRFYKRLGFVATHEGYRIML